MISQVDIVKRESIPPSRALDASSGRSSGAELREFSLSAELELFSRRVSDLALTWVVLHEHEALTARTYAKQTLVVVHDGSGFAQGDTNCQLEAGDILVIPPGSHQAIIGGPGGLHAISIELDGGAACTGTTVGTLPPPNAALQILLDLNEARLQAFTRRPLFTLLGGALLRSGNKRAAFLAALGVWYRGRLPVLAARQASCDNSSFAWAFTSDLYNALAQLPTPPSGTGVPEPLPAFRDARMEAFIGWFAYQMNVLDNVEKAAIVHLVLEPAETAIRSAMSANNIDFRPDEGGNYFGINPHRGWRNLELFADQSPKAHAQLRNLTAEAWAMVSAMADRLAAIAQAG